MESGNCELFKLVEKIVAYYKKHGELKLANKILSKYTSYHIKKAKLSENDLNDIRTLIRVYDAYLKA